MKNYSFCKCSILMSNTPQGSVLQLFISWFTFIPLEDYKALFFKFNYYFFLFYFCHMYGLIVALSSQYYQESNISSREIWSLLRGYSEDATISDIPFRAYGTGLEAAKAITLFTINHDQDYFCENFKGYKVSMILL